MYCRSCQYELVGLDSRVCPECGHAFDPTDPKTYWKRRRRPQAILGVGLALLIGGAALLGFWAARLTNYWHSRHAAFLAVFGVGLFAGVACAVIAGWNRSWLGRTALLPVGILCVWLGLFLGSDYYFQVWQTMPNPPNEAFADTAPIGAFLLGWLPASIVVAVVFALSYLVFALQRQHDWPGTPSS